MVFEFQPSVEVQQRVRESLQRGKTSVLGPEERRELDHADDLELLLMNLAKARARDHLWAIAHLLHGAGTSEARGGCSRS